MGIEHSPELMRRNLEFPLFIENKMQGTEMDMYQILDIQKEKAMVTEPMDKGTLENFVNNKYMDQPLRYFNENRTLWIINLTSREVRPLSIKIEIPKWM